MSKSVSSREEGQAGMEGFLCPMCMADLQSFHNLQKHFENKHSNDDKDIFNQIKGAFSKAKEKIFNKDPDAADTIVFAEAIPERTATFSNADYDASFWEPQEIGTIRLRFEEFRSFRDARIDRTVVETNRIIIRLGKILQLPESVSSKRKEYEKTLVPWVADEDVPFCPTCGDKFNIARRRHHCRLCGAIMCTKCSIFLSIKEAEDIIEKNNQAYRGTPDRMKSNQPTLPPFTEEEIDKIRVRVCVECDKVLQRNREKLNLQLESSLLVLLHSKMIKAMETAITQTPEFLTMAESLNKGEEDFQLDLAMEKRVKLMQAYEAVDVISKKIAALSAGDEDNPLSRGAARLQSAIRKSASNFLQNNMLSLPSLPSAPKLLVLQSQRRAEHEKKLRKQREEARRLREEQRRQQEIERLILERDLLQQKRTDRSQENVLFSTLNDKLEASEQPGSVTVIRDPGWSADLIRPKPKDFTSSAGHTNPFEISGDESDENEDDALEPLKEQISYVTESMKQAQAAGMHSEVQSLERNLKELQLEYKRQKTIRAFRTSTSEKLSFNSPGDDQGNIVGEEDVIKHQINYITKCIKEARAAGKTDEVHILTENLNEMKLLYDKHLK